MDNAKAAQAAESLETLRELLPTGTDVYSIVRSVSKSGMSRKISFHVVKGSDIRDITWHVGNVLGYKLDTASHALKVSGAGMDMCFSVVYGLGRALFPHGVNSAGADAAARDGGYALTSRIL